MTINSAQSYAVPAGELYWGVLNTTPLSDAPLLAVRPAERRRRLSYLFESVLPMPVDDVHAVYHDLGGQRVLACGIDRDALNRLRDARTESVHPASVPASLGVDVDPHVVELLSGPFRAIPRMHRQRRVKRLAVASIAVCGLLLAVGLERRADLLRTHAEHHGTVQRAVYESVLGSAAVASGQPPSVQLTSELRRLQRSRAPEATSTDTSAIGDSSIDTAALLIAWPDDMPVRVRRLKVARGQAHLTVDLGEQSDADILLTTLAESPGWLMVDQRVDRRRGDLAEINVTARLTRVEQPSEIEVAP